MHQCGSKSLVFFYFADDERRTHIDALAHKALLSPLVVFPYLAEAENERVLVPMCTVASVFGAEQISGYGYKKSLCFNISN